MTTTKVKVSDLIGVQLDWAVFQSIGGCKGLCDMSQYRIVTEMRDPLFGSRITVDYRDFRPSTDWGHGGPIIEREQIWLGGPFLGRKEWSASVGQSIDEERGQTPLIAAMRAFVASKLGDEVEVPEVQS